MTLSAGVPAAVPVAWSNPRPGRPDDGQRLPLPATTTPSNRSSSSRTGRRALDAVRSSLSARDQAVVQSVADHRYVDTRHVEQLLFAGHATPLTGARVCRRVLARLSALRLIEPLERRIGGVRAGSASYVWQLGPVGDRLLHQPGQPRRRRHEPGLLFLDHCLAIATAHLALVTADRAGQLELVDVQLEPACWRDYQGLGGARLVLQPDLSVTTGDPADAEYVNTWFIEIDRGTEHTKRRLAKCGRYQDYRRTGAEQAAHGSFPQVVWVMPDATAADRLQAAIAASTDLDARLFRTTTMDGLTGLLQRGTA